MASPGAVVVLGGEGFLGRRLAARLAARFPGAEIHSLDVQQRFPNQPSSSSSSSSSSSLDDDHNGNLSARIVFTNVDIANFDSLLAACAPIRPRPLWLFHTASPWSGSGPAICHAVNVQGTINLIAVARRLNVQRLIYTSSAGVVYSAKDLINVDERLPFPSQSFDHYNLTKAKAEALVLDANANGSLLTCAIRPAGIFGPGDRQAIPSLIQVFKDGHHRIQLGNNTNLFDWTYVDNVVEAHILAALKLDQLIPLSHFALATQPVWKTVPKRDLPTTRSVLAQELNQEDHLIHSSISDEPELIDLSTSTLTSKSPSDQSALESPSLKPSSDPPLPAKRSRWDQWSSHSTDLNHPSSHVPVAGQAFFITNGEPIFFWDFARSVWSCYAKKSTLAKRLNLNPNPPWVLIIPSFLAVILAHLAQFWSKITGRSSVFTPSRVRYACTHRYHNIEKARVVLGYEPLVGVQEGIERAVEWYVATEQENSFDEKRTCETG